MDTEPMATRMSLTQEPVSVAAVSDRRPSLPAISAVRDRRGGVFQEAPIHNPKREGRSGQAIVEFIVGIVAVLALLAGIFQVASLTRTHSDTMIEARKEVAAAVMQDVLDGANILSNPDYIQDWKLGDDNKPHTRDDKPTLAQAWEFDENIVNYSVPGSDWTAMSAVPNNGIQNLHGNPAPEDYFGLLNGFESRDVKLIPAARHLYYNAESVEVQCNVWMTWTKGIY